MRQDLPEAARQPVPCLLRLQRVGLRATVMRICILQAMEAAGDRSLGADEVYQALLARGTRASFSTVCRVIQQFESAGLLLREWGAGHKARHRIKPAELDGSALLLECRQSGRRQALADARLLEDLRAAVHREGLVLADGPIIIQVDGVPRA